MGVSHILFSLLIPWLVHATGASGDPPSPLSAFLNATQVANATLLNGCPMMLSYDYVFPPFLRRNEYTGKISGIMLEIAMYSIGCRDPIIIQRPADRDAAASMLQQGYVYTAIQSNNVDNPFHYFHSSAIFHIRLALVMVARETSTLRSYLVVDNPSAVGIGVATALIEAVDFAGAVLAGPAHDVPPSIRASNAIRRLGSGFTITGSAFIYYIHSSGYSANQLQFSEPWSFTELRAHLLSGAVRLGVVENTITFTDGEAVKMTGAYGVVKFNATEDALRAACRDPSLVVIVDDLELTVFLQKEPCARLARVTLGVGETTAIKELNQGLSGSGTPTYLLFPKLAKKSHVKRANQGILRVLQEKDQLRYWRGYGLREREKEDPVAAAMKPINLFLFGLASAVLGVGLLLSLLFLVCETSIHRYKRKRDSSTSTPPPRSLPFSDSVV